MGTNAASSSGMGEGRVSVDAVAAGVIESVDTARRLFREYADSLVGDAQASLCFQGFEKELEALPAKYAEPGGCILLARLNGTGVGCVALRAATELDPTTCEMKRLYVQPEARGKGVGRTVVMELISRGRTKGYSRMVLDTEPSFVEAVGLYRSLGFRHIERYNADPAGHTMYLGLRL